MKFRAGNVTQNSLFVKTKKNQKIMEILNTCSGRDINIYVHDINKGAVCRMDEETTQKFQTHACGTYAHARKRIKKIKT